MRKNKLSFIFAILTLVCIFSVAAIADQCGCRAVPVEEKVDVDETEEASKEEMSSEEETSEEAEGEQTEETIEEETSESEESAEEEETSEGQEQAEAPTIELEIYEGPIYSQSDNVCFYRIKANVTGIPNPDVEFSKDDSGGAWGDLKVQINLSDPSDTYALKANATNTEGTASNSINLSWGCPITNNPPVISDLFISPGTKFTGSTIDVIVTATDPDGDSLNYNWSADGGFFDSTTIPDTEWTAPGTAGNYNITVAVDDGNGGQAEKTVTVEVLIHLFSISLPQIPGGGTIHKEWSAVVAPGANVGDSVNDRPFRGFLSFDISSLAGKAVISAEIEFKQYYIDNDPYSIIEKIWVDAVYWGTDDIQLGDYDISGVLLGEYDIPIFTCSSTELMDALNQAINDGHDRFQIRLRHKGFQTNHDGIRDTITYGGIHLIKFNVTYLP